MLFLCVYLTNLAPFPIVYSMYYYAQYLIICKHFNNMNVNVFFSLIKLTKFQIEEENQ